MSIRQTPPSNPPSGFKDEDVQNMLSVLIENHFSHQQYLSDINAIKELKKKQFIVREPVAGEWVPSMLPYQVVSKVWKKLQRPAMKYSASGMDPIVAKLIRDGVDTAKEDGGLTDVLTSKPSAYNEALSYGNGTIMLGTPRRKNDNRPVIFDNITPGTFYADSNATVFHSKGGVRSITRGVLIMTYDYDQAWAEYKDFGVDFGLGEIPRIRFESEEDFDKNFEQRAQAKARETEIAIYWDIGGDEPVMMIAAGASVSPIVKFKGTEGPLKYPFFNKRTGKNRIPVFSFRCIDSDEGLFDHGYLTILYRYIIARQQLFNKQFGQTSRALTDIKVLNTGKMKGGRILKKISDARKMGNAGQLALIINDSGEQMQVTKMEAEQYEQGLAVLKEDFEREMKRLGINLDEIGQPVATKATQILQEAEAGDETAQHLIDKSTSFFEEIDHTVMDMFRNTVSPNDKTPIRTSVRIPKVKRDELTGETKLDSEGLPDLEKTPQGQVMMENIQDSGQPITYGDIKKLLDENEIFVETDTKSGVRKSDRITTARALLMLRTATNPAMVAQANKMLARANNIEITEGEVEQMQAESEQKVAQGGVEAASKALEEKPL